MFTKNLEVLFPNLPPSHCGRLRSTVLRVVGESNWTCAPTLATPSSSTLKIVVGACISVCYRSQASPVDSEDVRSPKGLTGRSTRLGAASHSLTPTGTVNTGAGTHAACTAFSLGYVFLPGSPPHCDSTATILRPCRS